MNITKLNFGQLMPKIMQMVKQSHFVSMDLQMSGIISPTHPQFDPSLTDSIQLRYHKTKQRIQQFIPLQLGLCLMKYEHGKIIYNPLNIYLYPSAIGEAQAEQFIFNSQSMRFLANNSFDFNKLFYEGVPYFNLKKVVQSQQRDKIKKIRQQMHKLSVMKSPQVISFISIWWDRVKQWIMLPEPKHQDIQQQMDPLIPTHQRIVIDIRTMRLKAYKALIDKIKEQNPNLILKVSYLNRKFEQVDASDPLQIIKRAYIKIERSNQIYQQNQIQTKSIPLINPLIEQIIHNKIPLLVHNGYLDLMHIYNRFIDELPAEQNKFRQKIHHLFPILYDTKYICNNNPVILKNLKLDSSLGKCYEFFRKKSIQSSQAGNQNKQQLGQFRGEYNFDDKAHHQAGFDALMTGYTFINAMKMLHKPMQKLITSEYQVNDKFYVNKVPQGNIRVPFNFGEKDDKVLKSYDAESADYFHFKLLPTLIQTNKIVNLTGQSLDKIETKVQQYFLQKYGSPIIFYWKGGKDSLDFTISFLKIQSQNKFKKEYFGGVQQKKEYCLYDLKMLGMYLVRLQEMQL